MNITIRAYQPEDLSQMIDLWNEVVEKGIAFPQEELLTPQTGAEFFSSQTYSGVAVNSYPRSLTLLYYNQVPEGSKKPVRHIS